MSLAATLTSPAKGECCCHHNPDCISIDAYVIAGSPDIFINGLPAARLGDPVRGTCGHIGAIVSGSNSVFSNGLPAASIGDIAQNCINVAVIGGSSDTLIS